VIGAFAHNLAAGFASFAVLALMFVPLERAFPARRRQPLLRPALLLDACFFFGQYLVFTTVAVAVIGWSAAHLLPRGLGALTALVRAQPLAVQAVLALALGDLCVYWFHRACHRYDFLWRFHAVHHSAEHLDWLAAHREHPIDGILTQLCMNLPALLLGVRMDLLAGLVLFRGVWAIFVHANVRLPLGPLRFLLGAPELHHWHHARTRRTRHNFANLAPWLDWLFGTHHLPDEDEALYPLGIPGAPRRGYLALLLLPFVSRR
jgi:sterol desaturase/sphingolipid hydroxylase (fatty acid hydroxylase superfamily)